MPISQEEAAAKYGHRYTRYQHYRNVGDPMADAVVESLDGATTDEAHAIIQRAIELGPDGVADAPQAVRDFAAWAREVPYWVDFELMEKGADLFVRNAALVPTIVVSMALPFGYSTQSAQTLYKTSVMSGYATKRLRETNRQIFEVGARDGLKVDAPGWKICLQVRMIHAIIRDRLKKKGDWDYQYGVPLNNIHLSMLASVLGSYIVEGLKKLNRKMTETEMDGYVSVWRYAGYLMGVQPELLVSSHVEGMRHLGLVFDCELEPGKEAIALIHELFSSVGAVGNIQDAKQAALVSSITMSLAREFIGKDLADKLQLPPGMPHFSHAGLIAILDAESFASHFGHLSNTLNDLQVKLFQNLCYYSGDDVLAAFPMPSKIGDF